MVADQELLVERTDPLSDGAVELPDLSHHLRLILCPPLRHLQREARQGLEFIQPSHHGIVRYQVFVDSPIGAPVSANLQPFYGQPYGAREK